MANSKDLTVDEGLVRTLAALLEETGLTEIEYAVGERRIRVVRGAAPVTLAMPAATPAAAAAPAASAVAAALPAGALTSPMVGTVYLAPAPEAPPFVKLGDLVREGQTLLIIEAMKVMNQIPAPRAGRVAQILVSDGGPVEFGQALLVLD